MVWSAKPSFAYKKGLIKSSSVELDIDTYADMLRDNQPTLSNEQKTLLYGLIRQAKEGDNTVASKPSAVNGFEAGTNWDAWEA